MDSFFTQHFSEDWLYKDLMIFWHRLNLHPNEHVIFIYGGAPAHNNPAILGPNSELKKLPPYSAFLNIVEQAIRALKAAIKADISRPEQQEQMNKREEARRKDWKRPYCVEGCAK